MKRKILLIVLAVIAISIAKTVTGGVPTLNLKAHRNSSPAADTDVVSIYFSPGATDGYDACCDVQKLMQGDPGYCNIWGYLPGYNLSIDGLPPLTASKKVQLGFSVNTTGICTITAAEVLNFTLGTTIYLVDTTATGVYQTELTKGASYTFAFTSYETDNDTRFYLIFNYQIPITPAITPEGPTTFCQGDSVKLDANTGTGYTYQWQNGSGNITGATNSSLTIKTAGNYDVIITDGYSVTSSPTTVTVNPTPTTTISPAGPVYTNSSQILVTNPQLAGYTYMWYKNDTLIASATDASYNAVAPTGYGNYTVNVTLGSCSVMSIPVAVEALEACPQVTNLEVTKNIPGKVIVNWTAHTTGQVYIVKFVKVLPPIPPATDSTLDLDNIAYRVTTTYPVSITTLEDSSKYVWSVKAWCGSKNNNLGYVKESYFTTPGESCPFATNLQHSNIQYNSAELSWKSEVPTATYKIRYYVNNGQYVWHYKKFTTSDIILTNLQPANAYGWQVKVLCDNNNAVNYSPTIDFFSTSSKRIMTKSDENTNNDIIVYPNPSSGKFTLALSGIENTATVKIINLEGQEVYKRQIESSINEEIDLSDLAKGIYFVRLIKSDNTEVKKIVIQ